MSTYGVIFSALFCTLLGYWFCGHSIAVLRRGGPVGDGYSSYQRASHPVRFSCYVIIVGTVGALLASFAIASYVRLWKLIITS